MDRRRCHARLAVARRSGAARGAMRIPPGHPKGFFEAFANVYRGVAADIHASLAGVTADPIAAEYPRVESASNDYDADFADERGSFAWRVIPSAARDLGVPNDEILRFSMTGHVHLPEA